MRHAMRQQRALQIVAQTANRNEVVEEVACVEMAVRVARGRACLEYVLEILLVLGPMRKALGARC